MRRRHRRRPRRRVPRPITAADRHDADCRCSLLVGRSTVLDIGTPIARVSLTSADIADALVTSTSAAADQRQDAGHDLDVRLGSRPARIRRYEVDRAARPRAAGRAAQAAVPERDDRGRAATAADVVLSGTVSNKDVMEQGRQPRGRLRREEGRGGARCCRCTGARGATGAAAACASPKSAAPR